MPDKSAFDHLVERQVRNWELAQSQKSAKLSPADRTIFGFISISHSVGLPTAEMASRIGEQLGWPVFDREILHEMAGNDEYRERVYQHMDQRDLGWLEEVLLGLIAPAFARNDYFHNLVTTVLSIARRCHVIFVGHATDMILPRDYGLRVRLVATREFCTKAHSRKHGMTEDLAAKEIAKLADERSQFVRNHFHLDPGEQSRHDLIVNMERFSVDDALALILAAVRARDIED